MKDNFHPQKHPYLMGNGHFYASFPNACYICPSLLSIPGCQCPEQLISQPEMVEVNCSSIPFHCGQIGIDT